MRVPASRRTARTAQYRAPENLVLVDYRTKREGRADGTDRTAAIDSLKIVGRAGWVWVRQRGSAGRCPTSSALRRRSEDELRRQEFSEKSGRRLFEGTNMRSA